MTFTDSTPLRDEDWFRCFGCSPGHPYGLRLNPQRTAEDEVACEVVFPSEFCSYPGIVHGGIVCTAADDVMANLVLIERGFLVFSATLRARFLRPVLVNEPYRIVARITAASPGRYHTRAEVYSPDGEESLLADGTYAHVRASHVRSFPVDSRVSDKLQPYLAPPTTTKNSHNKAAEGRLSQ